MNNQRKNGTRKRPIEKRTKQLLIDIGNSFKYLRKRAGYGNATDFAINRSIPEGTYGKHEAGIENMTIGSLINNMKAHGLKDEDVFNIDFLNLGKGETNSYLTKSVTSNLANQVRLQLMSFTTEEIISEFDEKDVLDIHAILIEGNKPTSKKNLIKSIDLSSKTDRFERLLSFLKKLKLIQMTDPNNPNSPKQKYFTTEKGKKVLRLDKENI